MGLFDVDLTRPRRVKAATMFVFAAIIIVLAVAATIASGHAAALWIAAVAVPCGLAGALWVVADRTDQRARERGRGVSTRNDPMI